MFIIFNKQKIYSYLVALSTVIVLFIIAFAVMNGPNNEVLQTSGNQVEQNNIENKINLQNNENKTEKKMPNQIHENNQNKADEENNKKQDRQSNDEISNKLNK